MACKLNLVSGVRKVSSCKGRNPASCLLLAGIALAMVLAAAIPAMATTYDWLTSGVDVNMSGTAGNWNPATVPTQTDIARWSAASYTYGPQVNANQSIGQLLFDSGNTGSVTIDGTSTLTVYGIGSTGIQMNNLSGPVNINAPLALQNSQTWTNNSASLLTVNGNITNAANTLTVAGLGNTTLSGSISGSAGLTKTGIGVLTLNGTAVNTFTGGLNVNGGSLTLDFANLATPTNLINSGNALAFGGGSLLINSNSSTNTAQTVASLAVNSGANTISLLSNNSKTNTLNITSTAINRTAGTALNFVLPTNTSVAWNPPLSIDINIIGRWATTSISGGSLTYATVSGGKIAGLGYTGGTDGTTISNQSGLNTDGTSGNFTLTGTGGAIPVGGGAYTLRYTGSDSVTLSSGNLYYFQGIMNVGTGTVTLGAGNFYIPNATTDLVITGPGNVVIATGINSNTGAGLTMAGGGILTLSGVNGSTGTTTVDSGELDLNSSGISIAGNLSVQGGTAKLIQSNQIANAKNVVVKGGALNIQGFNETVANVQLTGGAILGSGGTLTSTAAFDLQNGSVSAILGGTAGLTKSTIGTVVLTGSNSYTGATSVNGGILDLGGSGATGSINSLSTLSLGGGTLNYTRTGNTTQTFASTVVAVNASASSVTSTVSTVAGDTLALGAIARNVGGTVDFGATGGTITTPTVNTGTSILGGWATSGGTTWAVSAGNGTTAGAITGLPSGSYTNDTWLLANNTTVTLATNTAYSGVTTNSLRFNNAAADTVTLGGTNIITTGGILVSSNVGNNLSTITGGTLKGANGKDLVVIQNNTSNGLTIASIIADNGTATGLTKSGPGLLTLSGNNTFTGSINVNAGTLALSGNNATLTAPITVNNGTLTLSGTTSTTTFSGNNGTLNITGGVTTTSTGFYGANTPNGVFTLNMTGGTLNLSGGAYTAFANGGVGATGTVNITNATINDSNSGGCDMTNNAGSVATVNINNGGMLFVTGANGINTSRTGGTDYIYLNSGGTLQATKVTGSYFYFNGGTFKPTANTTAFSGLTAAYVQGGGAILDSNGYSYTFAQALLTGVASGTDGGLTKNGLGTVTVSGANTYNGPTTVNTGTLDFASPASFYNSTSGSWTPANVTVASGATLAVQVGASNFTSANVDTLRTNLGSSTSNTGLKPGAALGLDTTPGSFTYSSAMADISGGNILNLNKLGGNTLTLQGANTYTGTTTLTSGILQADGATALGNGGNITFAGGTLQYTPNSSPNWGTRIKNSSSAITLDTNSLSVTLNGAIDVSNSGGLTKAGAGTLILTGANTYTGTTTLTVGNLNLGVAQGSTSGPLGGGSGSLPTGSIAFNGGTLQYSPLNTTDYSSKFTATGNNAYRIDTNGQNVSFASGMGLYGTSGLTKLGLGTLTLSGSSVYTGTTTVSAGVLALDFSNLGTPTNLIGSALTIGGGAMTITAKTGAVTTNQTFSVAVSTGGASLLVDPNNGTATTVTLGTLPTLTSWVAGTNLVLGKAVTTNTGAIAITTTTNNDGTGIYGGHIVFANGTADTGYDWATTSAGTPYTLSAYGGYATLPSGNFTGGTDTNNSRMNNSVTLNAANWTTNTLKMETGVTLANGGFNTVLTAGGLLSTGVAASTISGTGTLTAGNTNGSYDLTVNQYNSGGLTISAPIVNNGANAVNVVKAGTQTLTLSGANTYSGTTYVNTGALVLGSPTAIGSSSMTITGGGVQLGANVIVKGITVNNPGTALLDSSSSTARTLILGTSGITVNNTGGAGAVTLGDATNTMDVALNGTQTWTVASGTTLNVINTVTNNSGNLIIANAGTVNFSGGYVSNNQGFELRGGVFNWTAGNGLVNTFNSGGSGQTTCRIGWGATFNLSGGVLTVACDDNFTGGNSEGFTISGGVSGNANGTLNVSGGTFTSMRFLNLSGVSQSLPATGSGILTVSGTGVVDVSLQGKANESYPGGVQFGTWGGGGGGVANLNGGTVKVGGVTGFYSYGTGSTFNLNGGTIQAMSNVTLIDAGGTYLTTNVLTNGAVFDTNGFTTSIGSNVKLVHLSGDSGTDGGLTKNGTGTLTLASANTFNGPTAVNAGTLIINGVQAPANGVVPTVTVASGAALGGSGNVGGNVVVSAGGALNLTLGAAVGTLTVPGTLTLNGISGSKNLLYFDTTASSTDSIAVTGAVTSPGANGAIVSINGLSAATLAAGTYNLITGASGIGSTKFALSTTKAFGNTFTLGGTGGTLSVTAVAAAASPTTAFWSGASDTNWTTLANWKTAVTGNTTVTATPGPLTAVSLFTTTPAGTNLTTTLGADFDILSLNYPAAATSNTTIAGANMLSIKSSGITLTALASAGPVQTISANIGLEASQSWTVNTNAALTVSGVISDFGGSYGLTKDGAGTLTLSGVNTYLGTTTVKLGTLTISSPGTLGGNLGNVAALTMNGGLLDLGTTTQTVGAVSITTAAASGNTIQNGSLIGTSYAASNTSGNAMVSANLLVNGVAGFTMGGAGTVTLSGANTYIGWTSVTAGTLAVSGAGTLGNAAPLSITGGAIDLGNTTQTVGFVEFRGGTVQNGSLNASAYNCIEGTTTITANLTGSANFVLMAPGIVVPTAILSGNNSYTGATLLGQGTLQANNANALGNGGDITFANKTNTTPTLQYTLASAGQDWSTRFKNSAKAIRLDTNGQNVTLAGIIDGTNTGGLTKIGNGTLTLSGANTYSGVTTVAGGILAVPVTADLPNYNLSGKVAFTTAATATLAVNMGGPNDWTTAQVDTLLTNATKTLGALGIDTTNVPGGNLTQWTAFTSTNFGTTLGLNKLGSNTLTLNQFNTYGGTTIVTAGTLKLAAGNNTIAANKPLVVNGGTLDMGTNNQYFDNFTGTGGIVTGTGGTFTTNAANGTFAGSIQGSLNFVKAGANTLILTADNTTTGTVKVIGGGLTLKDSGKLSANTGITVNGATLTIDNTGLSNINGRVNSANVGMDSGTIIYNGAASTASTEPLGTVTANAGISTITATPGSSGTAVLTLGTLTRTTGAIVNITGSGNINVTNALSGNVAVVGGVVPGLINGYNAYTLLGYSAGTGFGAVSTNLYNGTLTGASASSNITGLTAYAVTPGGQTVNSLLANLYGITITFASANDLLTITSGMFSEPFEGIGLNVGSTTTRGRLTSGLSSGELFYIKGDGGSGAGTAGQSNLNSVIVDNNSTSVSLVVVAGSRSDQPGMNPSISAPNTYTGGTFVQGFGAKFYLNATSSGIVTVPAANTPSNGLVINNGMTVSELNYGGQIAPSNIVTLNGGANLTLIGNNTLAGVVFNSDGGTAVPTVTPTGTLTVTGSITSTPSNVAVTPIISGGSLNLNNANTITVSPLPQGNWYWSGANWAPLNGLAITSVIQDGGSGFTLQGGGVLSGSAANTFTGQLTVANGVLNVGTSINNVSTNGPLGNSANSVILGKSDGSTGTIEYTDNSTSSSKPFTMADGGTGAFQVDTAGQTLTLSGLINGSTSNTGGLTKTGPGILTLTNNGNTYGGTTTVSTGTLKLAPAVANGNNINNSSAISINGGATLDVLGLTSSTLVAAQPIWAKGSGIATITGAVNAGSQTIDLQDRVNLGTLSISSGLTLANNATLKFDLGSSGLLNDKLAITGAASLPGMTTINVNYLTGLSTLLTGSNAYTLITASGGLDTTKFSLSTTSLSLTLGGITNTYTLALSGDATREWLTATQVSGDLIPLISIASTKTRFLTNATTTGVISGSVTNSGYFDYNFTSIVNQTGVTGNLDTFTPSKGTAQGQNANSVPYTASINGTPAVAGSSYAFGTTVTDGTVSVVSNTVSLTAVDQRNFNVGTPTIQLGRFLTKNTIPTGGTTAISSPGEYAITASGTLNGFTGTDTNDLTLTTTDTNVFSGLSTSQTATYTLGGTASTGALNGSFSSSVTAELGTIQPVVVSVTGTAVNPREVSGTVGNLGGPYHAGTSLSSLGAKTETFTSSGSHDITTDVTVAGLVFNGTSDVLTMSLTGVGTIAPSGTFSTASVVTEGGLVSTYNLPVSYTAQVTSGVAVWTSTASGLWGTHAGWTDSGGTTHAAPGTFAGFGNTDTATFNGSGSVTAIDLTGTNPSMKALSFSNSSYTLSGSSLTLNSSDGTATLTVSSGTQSINMPTTLASNANFAINGGALLLNSTISGSGGFTKSGSGRLTLPEANTLSSTGAIVIAQGTLATPFGLSHGGGGITLATGGILEAGVSVKRAVAGTGTVTATDDLTIGSSSQFGQFNQGGGPGVGGTLNIGSNAFVILSKDTAILGSQTNLDEGGSLITLHGAQLGNPKTVDATKVLTATGNAMINSDFVNNGIVHGPSVVGQELTFTQFVTGGGSLTGNIEFKGSYSPGNSPAIVSVENVLLSSNSVLIMEFAENLPGDYDQLKISGLATLNGMLEVDLLSGFTPSYGYSFHIFDGKTDGSFAHFNLPGLNNGLRWNTSNLYTTGMISVVPEPSALVMLGIGAIGMLGYAWRRRRNRSISPAEETSFSDNQNEGSVILSMPSRWTEPTRRAA